MSHNTSLVPGDWAAITPSDTGDHNLIGFYVGTTGDVAVVTERGSTTVFPNVPVGMSVPGLFRRIKSTGTTASGIVGAKP